MQHESGAWVMLVCPSNWQLVNAHLAINHALPCMLLQMSCSGATMEKMQTGITASAG